MVGGGDNDPRPNVPFRYGQECTIINEKIGESDLSYRNDKDVWRVF